MDIELGQVLSEGTGVGDSRTSLAVGDSRTGLAVGKPLFCNSLIKNRLFIAIMAVLAGVAILTMVLTGLTDIALIGRNLFLTKQAQSRLQVQSQLQLQSQSQVQAQLQSQTQSQLQLQLQLQSVQSILDGLNECDSYHISGIKLHPLVHRTTLCSVIGDITFPNNDETSPESLFESLHHTGIGLLSELATISTLSFASSGGYINGIFTATNVSCSREQNNLLDLDTCISHCASHEVIVHMLLGSGCEGVDVADEMVPSSATILVPRDGATQHADMSGELIFPDLN